MKTMNILISGFGGQGVLFTGKFLAYEGLLENKEVTWLPSYGPEMRGGTATCSVIISDDPVGSPIVSNPDVLIAMNLPSLDRYEETVAPGGYIFYDSTLIERAVKRDDVKAFPLPATALASENGFDSLANMILMGKIMKELGDYDEESVNAALHKVVSAKHLNLLEANKKAMDLGASYVG